MDSKRAQWLSDKYWKAESSIEEEKTLKEWARTSGRDQLNKVEQSYFDTLDELSELKLGDDFDEAFFKKAALSATSSDGQGAWKNIVSYSTKVAATVLIVLATGMILWNSQQQSNAIAAQQEDPRKAFEITKQALLLVSAKLNKGANYTSDALGKFDEAQTKIKSKNQKI